MTKVIYIMGTGRSGTTLLSILLGNNPGIFDTGEIMKFPKLQGKPDGFSEDSSNFQFWKKVESNYFLDNNSFNYDELFKFSKNAEKYRSFFLNFFNLLSPSTKKQYKQYINGLYNSIFKTIDKNIIIDSSKYPGRALLLYKYLKRDLYIIYLIRNPIGVVESFSKQDIEQPPKGFLMASIYYFVINFFCYSVKIKVPNTRFIKIRYEDLVRNPEIELQRIQSKFNINLDESINLVKNNKVLKTGYIFAGNRIRLNKEIKFDKRIVLYENTFKNRCISIINGIWY